LDGRPAGDSRDPALVVGVRHTATASTTQLLAQEGQDTRVGCPGSSTSETVSTACADGAMPAALPGEESISIPSKDAPTSLGR